jgi:AcrR family transcriptional regulator
MRHVLLWPFLAHPGEDEEDGEHGMTLQHLARDETRERILAVALQLIADHGFAATSTREISERLGFTKAALYYHFRTKDDLLAAIVAPAMEDLKALLDKASPRGGPVARRQFVEGYVDLVASHEDLVRVLSDDPSARRRVALTAAAPLYDRMARLLSGSEAPGTAQRARVRAALGAIHAALLGAAPDDDREVVRAAAQATACAALGLHSRRPSASV